MPRQPTQQELFRQIEEMKRAVARLEGRSVPDGLASLITSTQSQQSYAPTVEHTIEFIPGVATHPEFLGQSEDGEWMVARREGLYLIVGMAFFTGLFGYRYFRVEYDGGHITPLMNPDLDHRHPLCHVHPEMIGAAIPDHGYYQPIFWGWYVFDPPPPSEGSQFQARWSIRFAHAIDAFQVDAQGFIQMSLWRVGTAETTTLERTADGPTPIGFAA